MCDIGVKIFMFGIWNGNVWEFYDMVFDFKNEMCYILDMFEEFEVLVCWVLYEGMLCFFYCRFKYLRMIINCEWNFIWKKLILMFVDRIKNIFVVKFCIFVIMYFKCICIYIYNVYIYGLYCIFIKIYMVNMKKIYMNNLYVF